MASGSGSRNVGLYETEWIARDIPVPGVFVSYRLPNAEDCPTGCPAVDFMLQSCLLWKKPVPLGEENNALYTSLNYQDNNDANKRYHEELKQFRDDTRTRNGYNIWGTWTPKRSFPQFAKVSKITRIGCFTETLTTPLPIFLASLRLSWNVCQVGGELFSA
jgi:hypothetical protein